MAVAPRRFALGVLRLSGPVLRWSGLPFIIRETLQQDRVTIGYYHDPDPETVDRHLTALGKRYHFIQLKDYVDARRTGHLDALPSKSLVITVDDGVRGNRALLDVFRRHSVTPTIFLCSGIVGTHHGFWWTGLPEGVDAEGFKRVSDGERMKTLAEFGYSDEVQLRERSALSLAEIEQMRDLVDFQAHTVFHPILSRCTDERSRAEIELSKKQLERDFGLEIYALAYPNGAEPDFGDREVAYAGEAGYLCAVTTVGVLNDADTDLFRLRRISLGENSGASEAIARASGIYAWVRQRFFPGYVPS